MNTALQCSLNRSTFNTRRARAVLLGLLLAAGSAASALAQGQIASGTISGSGSGPYTYDLTFSDSSSATSPVGSVWYGVGTWLLLSAGNSNGRLGTVRMDGDRFNNSVQFVASSAANDIMPGHSLPGFSYQATFTPAQLAAAPNSATSVAYSGLLFSDSGYTFMVTTVPEPSAITLLLTGSAGLFLARRRRHA